METDEFFIAETYLSRKPRKGSFEVAVWALFLVSCFSILYWKSAPSVASKFPVSLEDVVRNHEYWRLITAILVHADLSHLLSNAIPLTFFSYLLYGYFGAAIFPGFSILAGALVNLISILTYPPGSQLVGASGLVYWMAGFWLTMFLLVERRFRLLNRIFRCLGFALITLLPTSFDPSVSYRAHAIGFFLGIIFAILYFLRKKEVFLGAERWESYGA
jgi:rhomboid protease GluP